MREYRYNTTTLMNDDPSFQFSIDYDHDNHSIRLRMPDSMNSILLTFSPKETETLRTALNDAVERFSDAT